MRAVLFDIDDTLVDYSSAERAGILDYLAELGVPAADRAAAADRWHLVQEQEFARYLAGELSFTGQQEARAVDMARWLGRPAPADPAAWFRGYRRHYLAAMRPFDDAADCLRTVSAVAAIGVVSNNDEAPARHKLARAGLLDRLACVVCVDTAGCAKPDPEIFEYACRALAVAPHEAAYVGDNRSTDAEAAHAAGLTGVWLDRHDTGVAAAPGIRRIRTLAALPAALGLRIR
ncbi:haloacid dehalogenase [Actinocatenispora thailandica]|uniref:Haloacid dehalogenase n=1 Tax=Actinocatenispora thailandica TaxID=227318 RepID=A0A7R7HX34_9ACTN|nr:HAD family hydrolase [Actinocatenispora thailandica]BCJ34718.1 haloacid dehalogenase [Actinocatenispora thailandica]